MNQLFAQSSTSVGRVRFAHLVGQSDPLSHCLIGNVFRMFILYTPVRIVFEIVF